MARQIHASLLWHSMPIVFNEDDHFDFEKADNNFVSAVRAHAPWGFFDYRMQGEDVEGTPLNTAVLYRRILEYFLRLLNPTSAA